MKKRVWAFLLAVAMAMSFVPRTRAVGTVWFVAVNDTIPMTMTADSEPKRDGNSLYLPYSVFEARPGGVAASYNQDSQTFVLFTRNKRLVYDLALDTRTTEDGTQTAAQLYYRNGLLFVPSSSAEYFGLKVSLLTSKNGYSVLRFTDGTQSYSDDVFLEKAESLISYQAEHSFGGPIGTEPTKPTQTDPLEETNAGQAQLHLCFLGEAVSYETLELLESKQLRGSFFVTVDQIKEDPALVRNLYVLGHTVGLTVPDGETEAQGSLEKANEELDKAIFRKIFLAMLPKEQADGVSGFCVIYEEDRTPSTESAGIRLIVEEDVTQALEKAASENVTLVQLRETSVNK